MNFDNTVWSKLHGASTHFPIALVMVALLCDLLRFLPGRAEFRGRCRFAGTLCLVVGTLGSFAAVASGLVVTKGNWWGHGTLLAHHKFVWPAFALMTGLAAWRVFTRGEPSRKLVIVQALLLWAAAGLMTGAGYWGGELFSDG